MEISAQKLQSAVERFCLYYQRNPSLIIGAGFSQGAALLGICLQKQPSFYGAAVLMAGFVPEREAARSSNAKVLVLHGEQDEIVSLSRAQGSVDYLRQLGFEVEFVTDPVRHKVGTQGMRRFKDFIREIIFDSQK